MRGPVSGIAEGAVEVSPVRFGKSLWSLWASGAAKRTPNHAWQDNSVCCGRASREHVLDRVGATKVLHWRFCRLAQNGGHRGVPIRFRGAMPRDGAIMFRDLIGKLDMLRVRCEKCGRDGCYGLAKLLARNMNDPCGAKCPDLPKVL